MNKYRTKGRTRKEISFKCSEEKRLLNSLKNGGDLQLFLEEINVIINDFDGIDNYTPCNRVNHFQLENLRKKRKNYGIN